MPTPFQLSGDPRWDKDGDLYTAYDLELGGDHIDPVIPVSESVGAGQVVKIADEMDQDDVSMTQNQAGVKVLSEKSKEDIKKMVEEMKHDQAEIEVKDSEIFNLTDEFDGILSSACF